MNRLRHLGSIDDLSTEEILALLDRAEQLRQGATGEWRPGRVLTLAFFESSTRTRVGFASAGARLGFVPIDLNAPRHSAGMSAQESLSDTIRVVSAYSDLLVLRHPSRSAWETAMEVAQCPMINGGCGAGEHPSQALIDLFAIRRAFGRLSGLRVGIVGDIAGSRAVHSFVRGLQRFGQAELRLMGPESRLGDARFAGASYGTALDLEGLDVVYMAGLPAGVYGYSLEVDGRKVGRKMEVGR